MDKDDDRKTCFKTIYQHRKNLTAGWGQAGRKELRDDVISTTNFFYGQLQTEMRPVAY